jgi:hypothetical protein
MHKYTLSYFGGISTNEGAPSTAFWDEDFRRLELAGTQADLLRFNREVCVQLLAPQSSAKKQQQKRLGGAFHSPHFLFFSHPQKKLLGNSQRRS